MQIDVKITWQDKNGETVVPSEVQKVEIALLENDQEHSIQDLTAQNNWATDFVNLTEPISAYEIDVEPTTNYTTRVGDFIEISADAYSCEIINVKGEKMAFDDSTYCDFDSTVAQVTAGKSVLLCVFSADGTDLLALAGQQSFELSIDADTTDASTKDSVGGWGAEIAGTKTWSISVDGLVAKGDDTQKQLLRALSNSAILCIKVVEEIIDENGAITYAPLYGGLVNATSYSDSAPHDDMRSYSTEFSGVGRLWIAEIATDEELASVTAEPSNRN